jgi:hypothetical protein
MKMYGFYSKQAADRWGSHIYLNPAGEEVEITVIGDTPENSWYGWEDKKSCGEVTLYLHKGATGNCEYLEYPKEPNFFRL